MLDTDPRVPEVVEMEWQAQFVTLGPGHRDSCSTAQSRDHAADPCGAPGRRALVVPRMAVGPLPSARHSPRRRTSGGDRGGPGALPAAPTHRTMYSGDTQRPPSGAFTFYIKA